MVGNICGTPKGLVIKVADALIANRGRDKTSAFVYAVGWTQHTTGVQLIRTAGLVQLLLGNIGRPGGGIMALRGHASIQGSTDIEAWPRRADRKSTRLNSSHQINSYAVFCFKKKTHN